MSLLSTLNSASGSSVNTYCVHAVVLSHYVVGAKNILPPHRKSPILLLIRFIIEQKKKL